MTGLAAAICVGVLMAASAAPGRRPERVRLLVPTVVDVNELAVLTQAELVAAGFEVDHRAVPPGPLEAWLAGARRDHVFAVVALEPAPAEVRLWLLDGEAGPDTLVEPVTPPAASAPVANAAETGEAATSRARTTLALRTAERIRAHRTARDARPTPVATAPALPAAPLVFEALLLAGRSLHPSSPALGFELALGQRLGNRAFWRLGLTERSPLQALAAPGGTARPYETALLAGLGLGGTLGRFTPALSLELGAQHTLLIGQGAQGFQGHTEGALSAVVAARLDARWTFGRLALLATARAWQLLPRPVVIIDAVTASRAGPGIEGGLGLAY